MANFSCQCGNQDLEYKSGVGKTGKKWQGWKCSQCKVMYGMDGKPWAQKQTIPFPIPQQQSQGGDLASLQTVMKKIDEIIARLKAAGMDLPNEETPF